VFTAFIYCIYLFIWSCRVNKSSAEKYGADNLQWFVCDTCAQRRMKMNRPRLRRGRIVVVGFVDWPSPSWIEAVVE